MTVEIEEFEDAKESESVNRRRTESTMAKRKKDKQRSTKHYVEN
jgi:hypothetical protein